MSLLLRLSSLPVDMRHHDSFLQEPGDGTRKKTNEHTNKHYHSFRRNSRLTTNKLQEATNEKQNFLHSSSFFLEDRLLTTNTWSCILLLALLLLLLLPERQTCDKGTTTTITTNPASSIFVSRRSRLPTRYNNNNSSILSSSFLSFLNYKANFRPGIRTTNTSWIWIWGFSFFFLPSFRKSHLWKKCNNDNNKKQILH